MNKKSTGASQACGPLGWLMQRLGFVELRLLDVATVRKYGEVFAGTEVFIGDLRNWEPTCHKAYDRGVRCLAEICDGSGWREPGVAIRTDSGEEIRHSAFLRRYARPSKANAGQG